MGCGVLVLLIRWFVFTIKYEFDGAVDSIAFVIFFDFFIVFQPTMKIFWLTMFVSVVLAEAVDDAPLTPEDKEFWDRFLKVDALSVPVTPPVMAPVVPCNPQDVECCVTSDCDNPAISVCEANVCIGKGNPRFTLTWSGLGTLSVVRGPNPFSLPLPYSVLTCEFLL